MFPKFNTHGSHILRGHSGSGSLRLTTDGRIYWVYQKSESGISDYLLGVAHTRKLGIYLYEKFKAEQNHTERPPIEASGAVPHAVPIQVWRFKKRRSQK